MPFTRRLTDDPEALIRLLQPETTLEKTIVQHPAVREGLLWGEPRFGHPEGTVAYHVREVLDNIDRVKTLSAEARRQLRLVALLHDSFKYQEDHSTPRNWSRHHSVLARRFATSYTTDDLVLDLIEYHDDAYYIWLAERKGQTVSSQGKTLEQLCATLSENMQMYYIFFKCDTQTGDKMQASLKWFEQRVPGIVLVEVRERW